MRLPHTSHTERATILDRGFDDIDREISVNEIRGYGQRATGQKAIDWRNDHERDLRKHWEC
jgi:hypothetical protein